MKIVVLAGGLSPERDVSLSSASLIANALIENGHDVLLLDLYFGSYETDIDSLFINKKSTTRYNYIIPREEPDLVRLKSESKNGESLIGHNVIKICQSADIIFIGLHGSIGENGQIQAIFDSYDIRYTGTGYIGSLLGMDKDISKKLMVSNKINTPNWSLINIHSDVITDSTKITYPCVVKPSSCGSSIGVTIVKDYLEFHKAIQSARNYDNWVMIEDMIQGREFSVGILNQVALPIIEIIPKEDEFYDYKNKYQSGLTKEICPANINAEITNQLQTLALAVHKTLRLGYYSRIDFIMDKNNEIYCLEANTLPGMTPTSLLPQEAKAVGITYNELCEQIAYSALMNRSDND